MNRRLLLVIAYCLLGGLPLTLGALGTSGFPSFWLAGVVMAVGLLPVSLWGPATRWGQFAVIAPVLWIVTALCTWSEALIFMPSSPMAQAKVSALLGALALYTVLLFGLVLLGPVFKVHSDVEVGQPSRRRPLGVALMVGLSGLAYLAYYFVTGSLTFNYFTRDYFPEALSQVQALGPWFWVIQFGRGVIMTLAIVPLVYSLRTSRVKTALAAGLALWVAGGLSPLLLPNELMNPTQRFLHVIEIFSQNAPLGVTAALLLLPSRGSRPLGSQGTVTSVAR